VIAQVNVHLSPQLSTRSFCPGLSRAFHVASTFGRVLVLGRSRHIGAPWCACGSPYARPRLSSSVSLRSFPDLSCRGYHCLVLLSPRPTQSRINTLDGTALGAVHRRARVAAAKLDALALPLLGSLALGAPGVDGGDLGLEGGVDGAVPLQGVEALELRRDDQGCKGLATAACLVW
jgi:hypothetical protein